MDSFVIKKLEEWNLSCLKDIFEGRALYKHLHVHQNVVLYTLEFRVYFPTLRSRRGLQKIGEDMFERVFFQSLELKRAKSCTIHKYG